MKKNQIEKIHSSINEETRDELLITLKGIESALERISLSSVRIAQTLDAIMKEVLEDKVNNNYENNLIEDDLDI
jgi:hypothetical protein